MFIEAKRTLLEEMDAIEASVAKRFKRNSHLLDTPKSKLDTLSQYELAHLRTQYNHDRKKVLEMSITSDDIYDPEGTFEAFDTLISRIREKVNDGVAEDVTRLYAPFSSASYEDTKILHSKTKDREKRLVKRKAMVSQAAAHIDLDRIFSPAEKYGKFVDLAEIHQYRADKESYVEYLHRLIQVAEGTQKIGNASSLGMDLLTYRSYLEKLQGYLKDFIHRSRPLANVDEDIQKLQKNEQQLNDNTVNVSLDGSVYCAVCDKTFAKKTVYDGHLNGKKHKAALKKVPDDSQNLQVETTALLVYTKPNIEATLAYEQRKTTMGEREKMIESTAVASEDEYTTVHEDSESSEEEGDDDYMDENVKDIPLGADGQPMPFWLYKLQGLNKVYTCEICGNVGYKGRVAFGKHFIGAKHQYGLKCLGITDESLPMFKSIVSIDEAAQLWKQIKRENSLKEGEKENAVEVEDNEGNVMLERDYNDLKKQGLL